MMKRLVLMFAAALTAREAFAQPLARASATPSVRSSIDALSDADVQQAISGLRSNFISSDTLNDQELARATLQGLIARLGRGAMVLADKDGNSAGPDVPAYSEILDNHVGYLRIGSFTNPNLQAVDKALANFNAKKVDAVVVDLRVDAASNDFATAAEFAKRFAPKGKTLFSIRKSGTHQDRTFTSDREPAYTGTTMVLIDGETSGAAEAVAGVIHLYAKALILGSSSAGRAVEYSDIALSGGKTLRVASGEVIMADGQSLFPTGVKPDVSVEMPLAEKRQIFQASAQKGMAPFVFEAARPHLNEAALIAGTNPELDEMVKSGTRPREVTALRDPVLQRAVDVVTSLAVYQKR